jgi:hypothetical protein
MKRVAIVVPIALWALRAMASAGCEAVPTLTFAQDDAAAGATPDAADGGAPPGIDADVESGCPGSDPPAAPFVCCGSVACEGQCTGQCGACADKCTTPGEFCCAKNNNVLCLSPGSICH